MPILRLPPEWNLGETPKVANTKLSDGKAGNLETVEFMRGIARQRASDPSVRQLALQILMAHKVPSNYYKDETLAIARFVKDRVRYVRDINGVETVTDPLTLIDQIKRGEAQGDCDDMSLLIATLLLSIGHQPYFRIVKYNNVVDYEKNPGFKKERIVLDSIIKSKPIGFEIEHAQGNEIKV
jgi:hypothetical protein